MGAGEGDFWWWRSGRSCRERCMSVAKLELALSVTVTIGRTVRLDGSRCRVAAAGIAVYGNCPRFADHTRLVRAGDQRQGRQGRSPVLATLCNHVVSCDVSSLPLTTINSSLNSLQTSMPSHVKTRIHRRMPIGSHQRRQQCFHQHPHTGPAARRTTPPCPYADAAST
jgi:hypothetical protein